MADVAGGKGAWRGRGMGSRGKDGSHNASLEMLAGQHWCVQQPFGATSRPEVDAFILALT